MAGPGSCARFVSLDRYGEEKTSCPTGVRTPTVQPVACRSTESATPAPSHVVQNVSKLQAEKGLRRAYIYLTLPTRTKLETFAEYKDNTKCRTRGDHEKVVSNASLMLILIKQKLDSQNTQIRKIDYREFANVT
jgi:hypothetical protein